MTEIEVTRTITVEITFVGIGEEYQSATEEAKQEFAEGLEDFLHADNVVVTKVQDFIIDKEGAQMRPIDAELLKRMAEKLIEEEYSEAASPKSWKEEVENFKTLIDTMPTIETKPVEHAHWEETGTVLGECSNCGAICPKIEYCGKCGAQMDERVCL